MQSELRTALSTNAKEKHNACRPALKKANQPSGRQKKVLARAAPGQSLQGAWRKNRGTEINHAAHKTLPLATLS
jgi:hypothetical protein